MTDDDRALDETLSDIRVLQQRVSERLDEVLDRIERMWPPPPLSARLAFIHIPKTGGGTLKGMIAAGGNQVVTSGNFFKGPEGTTAKLARKLASRGRRAGGGGDGPTAPRAPSAAPPPRRPPFPLLP